MNTETTKQLQGKLIDACDAMLGLVNMSSEQLVKIVSLERELAEANSKIIALTKSHDVVTRTFSQVDNELAEARQELSEWKTLQSWGGTPQIVDEFIKGQQTRIYAAQDAEKQRDTLAEALRNSEPHMRHNLNCNARLTDGQLGCTCGMIKDRVAVINALAAVKGGKA